MLENSTWCCWWDMLSKLRSLLTPSQAWYSLVLVSFLVALCKHLQGCCLNMLLRTPDISSTYAVRNIYIYTRSIVHNDNFCSFCKSMLKSLLFALLLTKIHTCKKYQSKSKQSFLVRIDSQPNGNLPNNWSDQKVKLGVYLSSKTCF